MAGRVVNVSTFYATEDGVIYHPVSDEAKKVDHDVEQARERLSNILKVRQQSRAKNRGPRSKLTTTTTAAGPTSNNTAAGNAGASGDYYEPESGSEEEYEPNHGSETAAAATSAGAESTAPLAIRQIERQLRNGANEVADRDQDKMNKLLARSAAHAKKGGGAKALPSQYVHKPQAADNAAKRAIVHHTGSHYVMAGSKQFQKGLRVKGVVSRHSVQGAKLQSARSAKRNGMVAREDARGERAEGGGKSQTKSQGKKKSKSKKGGEQA
jgi:hypothetical protein